MHGPFLPFFPHFDARFAMVVAVHEWLGVGAVAHAWDSDSDDFRRFRGDVIACALLCDLVCSTW